jgi:hypothetical protein
MGTKSIFLRFCPVYFRVVGNTDISDLDLDSLLPENRDFGNFDAPNLLAKVNMLKTRL